MDHSHQHRKVQKAYRPIRHWTRHAVEMGSSQHRTLSKLKCDNAIHYMSRYHLLSLLPLTFEIVWWTKQTNDCSLFHWCASVRVNRAPTRTEMSKLPTWKNEMRSNCQVNNCSKVVVYENYVQSKSRKFWSPLSKWINAKPIRNDKICSVTSSYLLRGNESSGRWTEIEIIRMAVALVRFQIVGCCALAYLIHSLLTDFSHSKHHSALDSPHKWPSNINSNPTWFSVWWKRTRWVRVDGNDVMNNYAQCSLLMVKIYCAEETWTLDRFDEYKTILWSQRGWRTRLSIHETTMPWTRWNTIGRTATVISWNRWRILKGSSVGNDWSALHARLQSYRILDCVLYGGENGLWAGRSIVGVQKCTASRHL